MSKIRVTRTLVYEGEEESVRHMLAKTALLQKEQPFPDREGKIYELPRKEEKLLSPAEDAWLRHYQSNLTLFFKSNLAMKFKNAFLAGFEAAEKVQTSSQRGVL